MSKERGKPFVGWMHPGNNYFHATKSSHCDRDGCYPVVVTPLLPDDPRPGETWLLPSGDPVEILSPPYAGVVVVQGEGVRNGEPVGYDAVRLRRPPVLRTVTLTLTEEEARSVLSPSPFPSTVMAKLAEALADADTPSPEPGR